MCEAVQPARAGGAGEGICGARRAGGKRRGGGDPRAALDARTQDVSVRGSAVELSTLEFKLLHFLASRPRQISAASGCWTRSGPRLLVTPRTVDVHIRRLREKIEAARGTGVYWYGARRRVPDAGGRARGCLSRASEQPNLPQAAFQRVRAHRDHVGVLDFYLTRYTAAQQRSSIGRRWKRGAHPGGELESVDRRGWKTGPRRGDPSAGAVTVIDPRGAVLAIRSTTPRAWRTQRSAGIRQATKGAPAWPRATAPRWTGPELRGAAGSLPGPAGLRGPAALPLSELDTAIGAFDNESWRLVGVRSAGAGHGVLVLPHIHAAGARLESFARPAGARVPESLAPDGATSSGRWQAP